MNFGVIPETFLERVALWRRLIPTPILDLLFGPLKARIIMAGVSLGVFEALRDQSRTAAELADALRLDRVAIELLLRALTHVQYLEERKARATRHGCGRAYGTHRLRAMERDPMAPPRATGNAGAHGSRRRFP